MKVSAFQDFSVNDYEMLYRVGEEFGFEIEVFERGLSSRKCNLTASDLVVLMGSNWSVYWPQVASEVETEKELIIRASNAGIPVLGICFGAQMIAHTFGGVISRSASPEFGWKDVDDVTQVEVGGRWMQWHSDEIHVPSHTSVIGTNIAGIQAIRYKRCLGVQFHPEANYEVVSKWISSGGSVELLEHGVDPDELLEETRRHEVEAAERFRLLMEWFLSDVAQVAV